MRKNSLFTIFTAIMLAVSLLGSACHQQQPVVNTQPTIPKEKIVGVRGGSLNYKITTSPKTFNYLLAADEASIYVAFFLTAGRIVEFNHDEQTYSAGLAEKWNLATDNRTVEIKLRDGLKFSDGHALTTDDVLFTMKALYDDKTASPIFRDAMTINNKPIEIKKIDELNFQLTFPETVATPENYLSNLAILPKHLLENDLNTGKLRESWAVGSDPKSIATAGAFSIDSVTVGERVTLKRNEHYWKKDTAGNQLPYIDKLVLEIVADANNAFNRLTQGSIDVIDRLRPTDFAALRSASQNNVTAYDLGPGLGTDHLLLNLNETLKDGKPVIDPVKQSWLKDVRFRRAISHAIDRKAISVSYLQGLATPLNNFVSPGNRAWASKDLPEIKYDLKQSQSLLTEAGFVLKQGTEKPELLDSKGNAVELTLIVPAENEPRKTMATVIQQDLAQIGIKLQVVPLEFSEFSRRTTQSFDYEIALFGTSATEPDPSSYSNLLKSDSSGHQWNPKQAKPATDWEAKIDKLVAEQSNSGDKQKRLEFFNEIQKIMAENLPIIPIVSRHITSASNSRLGNYRPSILPPYTLWNAEELFVKNTQ